MRTKPTNKAFIEKLIERIDRLDSDSIQSQFLRLVQEKGLMETIFQSIQEGILVLDEEAHLTYANRAAEGMMGFTSEKAIGHSVKDYLTGIEWERILGLDTGEWSRLLSSELEITYPEQRVLSFYMVPIELENEQTGAIVILRDITREREQEADLLESERLDALKLLAAGVAHEIGNPLNALSIHLQLLDRELQYVPEEEQESLRDILDVARNEVTRLDTIITQFLRAIRPSLPNMTPQQMDQVLEESLKLMEQEFQNRDIRAEVKYPKFIPTIRLDKDQVKQAFFNLIKNALQAMPDGGTLSMEIKCSEQFVGISFSDTGTGIDKETLGRIFEPYHTTKQEGSGLGLMIVQRIVQDHGGQVEVFSEPGAGTTFTLLFPINEQRVRLLTSPQEASLAS